MYKYFRLGLSVVTLLIAFYVLFFDEDGNVMPLALFLVGTMMLLSSIEDGKKGNKARSFLWGVVSFSAFFLFLGYFF
ncbi:hypothetical protein [Alteribacter natronophilus]|uniref:hypothetical protein n=1 Tax=Alteribacter natronophilus TaxID=2583810 RepID=UPI00110EE934|nr:hypothetical protein [Alteribacter natronophilus]TMW71139.1 hypothetical protein FGB90_14340 [Alteribacter natronophilus]